VAEVVRRSATDLGKKGWDARTGFGQLSIGSALNRPASAIDPLEPNDDVRFVNGSRVPKAPFLFSGKRKASLNATVDKAEDPVDLYRVKLRAHSRAKVIVKPQFGNPQLGVYSGAKSTVFTGEGRPSDSLKRPLTRSRHSGRHTERVTIRNRGGKSHVFYVAVSVQKGRQLDAAYGMTVKR